MPAPSEQATPTLAVTWNSAPTRDLFPEPFGRRGGLGQRHVGQKDCELIPAISERIPAAADHSLNRCSDCIQAAIPFLVP
jgi:hypothetical protein